MSGFAAFQASPIGGQDTGPIGAGDPVPFWDAVTANWTDATANDRLASRQIALRRQMYARHEAIEKASGKAMPLFDEWFTEDPAGEAQGAAAFADSLAEADYEAEVEKRRAANPAGFAQIQTRAALRAGLDTKLKGYRVAAQAAAQDHPVGAFLGASAGIVTDPPNIGAGILTGPWGAGRPLLARMAAQGAAQAVTAAAEVPAKAADAQVAGPAYTAAQAASEVIGAGVGGAGLEVAGTALKLGARAAGRLLPNLTPHAPPAPHAEFGDLSDSLSGQTGPDPAARRAHQVLDLIHRDDAAIGARDPAERTDVAAGLDRFEPPPASPDRDLSTLPSEPGPLTPTDYRGRTIWGGSFDPKALTADPVRFQFKAGGDAAGLTARLRGVDAWDATASGKVLVWEDRAGQRFIADGHQRLGLAQRMEKMGHEPALDGYLLREADGWSAAEARVVAALKNIREGSGAPLDAAKVLREAPYAVNDRSLPVSGEFMAQARGLALLADPAFRAVVNDVIPERYGAEIGLMAGTRPDLHDAMVGLLKEADPANADEARALIVEALQDDWIRREGDQADLFGYDPSVSAMIARAKVAAAVKRALGRDARLFSGLVKNADAIEAGGNALARDANEARLAVDRAALAVTSKLALRDGPIGQAMKAAVERVHAGETPATAARDVTAKVRAAIEAGERLDEARGAAIDPQGPSERAQAALEAFDDPMGKGAEEQAKLAPEDKALLPAPVHAAPEHPGPGDLWQASPAQLEAMLRDATMTDDQKLIQALGDDDAKEFKRLDRARNSMDPARADAADAEFDARFGELTPEQERLVYGIGETHAQAEDIKAVLDAHGDVLEGDPDHWVAYMAALSARRVSVEDMAKVREGGGSAQAQAAFVRMEAAYRAFSERGVAANDIPRRMAEALVAHAGWTPAQASEVIGGFVRDLVEAHAPPVHPGLFDDLALEDRHDKALSLLKRCAPED